MVQNKRNKKTGREHLRFVFREPFSCFCMETTRKQNNLLGVPETRRIRLQVGKLLFFVASEGPSSPDVVRACRQGPLVSIGKLSLLSVDANSFFGENHVVGSKISKKSGHFLINPRGEE